MSLPTPSLERVLCRRRVLSDLVVAYAFPPHTSGLFTLQILNLPHIWSGTDSGVIEPDDILALAAAVYMFSPQQRHPRTLPELLTAVAELLTRQQPDDAPVLHNASTIQQITHIEFWNNSHIQPQPAVSSEFLAVFAQLLGLRQFCCGYC